MSQGNLVTAPRTIPDDVLEDLELPGSGDVLEDRRDAVDACYQYLLEEETATKSNFQADVYPDHAAGYGSKGGWWNAIGPALREAVDQLDGVKSPRDTAGHSYEVVADVQDDASDDDQEARTIEEAKPFSEEARAFGEDVERAVREASDDVEDEPDGGDVQDVAAARELVLEELAALMAEGLSPSQALDYWATIENGERGTLGGYNQGEWSEVRGVSQQAISDSVRHAKGELER